MTTTSKTGGGRGTNGYRVQGVSKRLPKSTVKQALVQATADLLQAAADRALLVQRAQEVRKFYPKARYLVVFTEWDKHVGLDATESGVLDADGRDLDDDYVPVEGANLSSLILENMEADEAMVLDLDKIEGMQLGAGFADVALPYDDVHDPSPPMLPDGLPSEQVLQDERWTVSALVDGPSAAVRVSIGVLTKEGMRHVVGQFDMQPAAMPLLNTQVEGKELLQALGANSIRDLCGTSLELK